MCQLDLEAYKSFLEKKKPTMGSLKVEYNKTGRGAGSVFQVGPQPMQMSEGSVSV